ncbi:MAG TPA: ABC transporter permease [Thermoanaerobaculia bacterium]|nr:ABC transporter permease [Thermoanaerobaculia bacterium]
MSRRIQIEALLLPAATGMAALAAWQLAVWASHTSTFPAPWAVARGLAELARRGVLLPYVGDSLMREGAGFGLALLVGLPLGLAMGWYAGLARAIDPVVQILRPISPLAWIPVSIVLFGITNLATVFLIFLASLFPIVVAAANGVAGVPRMYLQAGRNFGLPPVALFRRVLFPAALPQVLGGLRVALGVSWLVVVAAEMIAVDSGLGYLVIDARNAGKRYDLVLAAILLIGGIGLALDLLARRIEKLPRVRWGFPAG